MLMLTALLALVELALARQLTGTMSDALSFAQHYYDYMRTPAITCLLCILVGPTAFTFLRRLLEKRKRQHDESRRPLDCFRLGLPKGSNLADQDMSSSARGKPQIKALFTYPVKSCRGIELAASEIGPTGLKYDRMFTFAQLVSKPEKRMEGEEEKIVPGSWTHQWTFVTQREFPSLALLDTELWVPRPKKMMRGRPDSAAGNATTSPSKSAGDLLCAADGGCIIIRFPYEPDFNSFGLRTETITIRLPLNPTAAHMQSKRYSHETIKLWTDLTASINVTNEIPPDHFAKLKYFLGVSNPLVLVKVDSANLRTITRSLPKDTPDARYTVGFADAFPIHMLSLPSIQALQDNIPAASNLKGKVEGDRFRANIFITGVEAHEEDTWKKIVAGRCIKRSGKGIIETDGEYHIACRTARCTLPNVDQTSGVRDANEPFTTLSKTRKVDEGAFPHPCLGMQTIPLFSQGLLKVGDEIAVVETGEHCYEKMFPGK